MIFGHNLAIYTVFLQGIRIWGQNMQNFRARREKHRKNYLRTKLEENPPRPLLKGPNPPINPFKALLKGPNPPINPF